ncbi:tRNA 2-selenouridine(34) synthase MnmH [soil metagenome]
MPIHQIDIEQFIDLASGNFIFDVRSPSEYTKAHIPGAISLPLFTDDQRKIIGTAYKQENRKTAVNHGLRFFSQRMLEIPLEAEKVLVQHKINSEDTKIFIHCWRGGMRSSSVAWLFNLYGYQVFTLVGGYKSFRRWVLEKFDKKYKLNILGGYTGSGKTEIIEKLKEIGKNVINLEKLASHRGSAFGSLGEPSQPSQEMFENCLAIELHKLFTNDNAKSQLNLYFQEIWIEDESRHIGKVGIPLSFWNQMRSSNLYFLEIPYDERLRYIVKNYGQYPKEDLINAILRIQKRLGGLDTANAVDFIQKGNTAACFSILLSYYDRLYKNSLDERENLASILRIVQSDRVHISVVEKLNALTKKSGTEIEII